MYRFALILNICYMYTGRFGWQHNSSLNYDLDMLQSTTGDLNRRTSFCSERSVNHWMHISIYSIIVSYEYFLIRFHNDNINDAIVGRNEVDGTSIRGFSNLSHFLYLVYISRIINLYNCVSCCVIHLRTERSEQTESTITRTFCA